MELDISDANLRGTSSLTLAQSLFLSISRLSFPFLLESGNCGLPDISRYSFMGAEPFISMKSVEGIVTVREKGEEIEIAGDPFHVLHTLLGRFRQESHPIFPFTGGAVGYIGYEAAQYIESVPDRKGDHLSIPDMSFSFYDTVVVVDHDSDKVYIASSGFPAEGEERERRSAERAAYFRDIIMTPSGETDAGFFKTGPLSSNCGREDYMDGVEKIKRYIAEGDVYQANLSQRFSASFEGEPFKLYTKLAELNPVPFGAYLSYPDFSVISNSPERFLFLREGRLETRPIKGTMARSAARDMDEAGRQRLRESAKDGAEHIMIVDLERNDLGRVCRYGTVRVDEMKMIESYSNLHHMVSVVSGQVLEGMGPVDCIRAAFPGGSITGAPKVRAMEIINEVEPNPRWIYTGSMGYIGFDGTMDLNIAIRTALVKAGKIYFSVGGGIVADSDPGSEYEETMLKGAVFRAMAAGGEE